jgi:hypothetical protein
MDVKHYQFALNLKQFKLKEKIHKKINKNLSGYKWKVQIKIRRRGLAAVIS